MKNPLHDEMETLRKRAVELGNAGAPSGHRELLELLKSEFPAVRRAAASALGKLIDEDPSLAGVVVVTLLLAIEKEEGDQVLQYMLKTAAKCASKIHLVQLDSLKDIARDPTRKDYVRAAANDVIALVEVKKKHRESILKHWCARCKRSITPEESAIGIRKYGKPYCRHCYEEKLLDDANFEANVDAAKRLRTTDAVAVQSQGERRIGDWLAAHHIVYQYDERFMIAGDTRIRPDFYLPEFDLYIEYWGMNTPEYVENMRHKKILYQRERRKLISLGWQDFDRLEDLLQEKLSRYIRL